MVNDTPVVETGSDTDLLAEFRDHVLDAGELMGLEDESVDISDEGDAVEICFALPDGRTLLVEVTILEPVGDDD